MFIIKVLISAFIGFGLGALSKCIYLHFTTDFDLINYIFPFWKSK